MFQNNETNLRQISRPTPPLGPLHMSPVNQDGPVTGMNFALGSYEKFQPGLRDENRSKILGTSSGAKFGKQRKHGETQKILTFGPILPSVTLKAVSLQLNGMLMMWKIQEAKKTMPSGLPEFILPFIPLTGMKCSYGKISSLLTEISVGKTEISGTKPARPLI